MFRGRRKKESTQLEQLEKANHGKVPFIPSSVNPLSHNILGTVSEALKKADDPQHAKSLSQLYAKLGGDAAATSTAEGSMPSSTTSIKGHHHQDPSPNPRGRRGSAEGTSSEIGKMETPARRGGGDARARYPEEELSKVVCGLQDEYETLNERYRELISEANAQVPR